MQKKNKKPPLIKDNRALEKAYEMKVEAFARECNNSFKYWLLSEINKIGENGKTQGNQLASTALKLKFKDLVKFWNNKASEFSDKQIPKHINEVLSFIVNRYRYKGFAVRQDARVRNAIKSNIEINYNLIKTIPQEILERYQSVILNNVNNLDRQMIMQNIKTIEGISFRRARTIARDQTHKALQNIAQAQAQSAGFEFYIWETSRDERVSKGYGGHRQLQGRIYKYSEASAVINSYGDKGHPSTRPNCRCVMLPYVPEAGEQLKLVKDSRSGDYYRVI